MNIAEFTLPSLEDISGWLGKLGGAPGYTLVFLFTIAVCKTLRHIRRFPNSGVGVAALLLGMVLNGLIADPQADNLSLRLWLCKNTVVGGIIGYAGYVVHKKLSKIKGFQWLNGDDDITDPKPQEPLK